MKRFWVILLSNKLNYNTNLRDRMQVGVEAKNSKAAKEKAQEQNPGYTAIAVVRGD